MLAICLKGLIFCFCIVGEAVATHIDHWESTGGVEMRNGSIVNTPIYPFYLHWLYLLVPLLILVLFFMEWKMALLLLGILILGRITSILDSIGGRIMDLFWNCGHLSKPTRREQKEFEEHDKRIAALVAADRQSNRAKEE